MINETVNELNISNDFISGYKACMENVKGTISAINEVFDENENEDILLFDNATGNIIKNMEQDFITYICKQNNISCKFERKLGDE